MTAQRKRTTEVVQLALQEPRFMQCWGSCFSPQQVDERLFVYTNLVVLTWLSAYEHRLLKDPQAREYLKVFFDSEIPRMYWERHGDWHRPRRRLTRSDRFFALVNDEYLTAIKAGPPSREHEPMTRVHHT